LPIWECLLIVNRKVGKNLPEISNFGAKNPKIPDRCVLRHGGEAWLVGWLGLWAYFLHVTFFSFKSSFLGFEDPT